MGFSLNANSSAETDLVNRLQREVRFCMVPPPPPNWLWTSVLLYMCAWREASASIVCITTHASSHSIIAVASATTLTGGVSILHGNEKLKIKNLPPSPAA